MTQGPPFRAWCPELEQALAEPFPEEVFEPKKKGRGEKAFTLDVLSWVWYEQRLNELVGAGGWQFGEPMIAIVKDRLVMRGSLMILGVTKWQISGAPLTYLDRETGEEREIGDADSGPEMNAFGKLKKRLCSEFGLGFYLHVESARKRIEKARREAGRGRRRQERPLAPRAAQPQRASAALIGEDLRTRLVEIAQGAGWSRPALEHLLRTYGFESTRRITVDKYDELYRKAGDRELARSTTAQLAQTGGDQGQD